VGTERTDDDVSLFLLNEFVVQVQASEAGETVVEDIEEQAEEVEEQMVEVEDKIDDPTKAASAQSILEATQATWSSVPGSAFAMGFGGTTSRCPSIVDECPGPQAFDGLNDVGWAPLSEGTLGVTWSTTGGADEADMALSTSVPWHTGCATVAGSFDLQSVLLHENGHVAGLDHASSAASVMYPYYQGASCSLDPLDEQPLQALYPAGA
jgi:hypothetical protein